MDMLAQITGKEMADKIDELLTEGKDYELDHIEDAYGDPPRNYRKTIPQEPGDYYAVYKGKSPYYGERSIRFTVYELNDLSAGGAGWVGRFSDREGKMKASTLLYSFTISSAPSTGMGSNA